MAWTHPYFPIFPITEGTDSPLCHLGNELYKLILFYSSILIDLVCMTQGNKVNPDTATLRPKTGI